MGGMAVVEAGLEGLVDEVDEVAGVGLDALGGVGGRVGLLVGDVDVRGR